MKPKETNARIIIDKMLLEAEWKLPGYVKDHEINVETEILGKKDYTTSKGVQLLNGMKLN